MSSSPYELQQRWNHATKILQQINEDYGAGKLDIEDAAL
jgi:hypothetical protein